MTEFDTAAYSSVHEQVGLFDATDYYGRLFAKGNDALDLLHRMSTNDIKPIEAKKGQSVTTFLTNEKARIIDVITVVQDETGDTLFVTSHGKECAVAQWLDKFTIMEDAQFLSATDSISQFGLYGPRANDVLRNFSDADLIVLPQHSVIGITIGAIPVTLTKSQRISESGWWLFTTRENRDAVWAELLKVVQSFGGSVISPDIFEVLRIEAGIAKAPNEYNEKHNPLETPLAQTAVSFTKGCYIGQEVIARLDSYDKVQRHVMGLTFDANISTEALPLKLQSATGDDIGELTSVTHSPRLGNIGLGYVRTAHTIPGTVVTIVRSGDNPVSATLTHLPFSE